MGVHEWLLWLRVVQIARCRFNQVYVAGLAALRHRINEDRQIVAVHERVGEVEATDAEIDYPHVFRPRALAQTPGNFAAEGVVAQEDISDASDENAGCHGSRRLSVKAMGSTSLKA